MRPRRKLREAVAYLSAIEVKPTDADKLAFREAQLRAFREWLYQRSVNVGLGEEHDGFVDCAQRALAEFDATFGPLP